MSTSQHQVTIGAAFDRWNEWKLKKGLKSDEAVALCLLDRAKTSRSSFLPTPAISSGTRLKFSKCDMRKAIKREVNSALKENVHKMQSLIDTVQQLNTEVDYEGSLRNLETRINIITRRAEVAFAAVPEKKRKASHPMSTIISDIFGSDSEDEDENSCSSAGLPRAAENVQAAQRKTHADKGGSTSQPSRTQICVGRVDISEWV